MSVPLVLCPCDVFRETWPVIEASRGPRLALICNILLEGLAALIGRRERIDVDESVRGSLTSFYKTGEGSRVRTLVINVKYRAECTCTGRT